ncbi:hypothetical protein [Egicoccus halophilus]|uniref:Uncharacterized protein n=1 Tax=Egicoccus halophilus TaxID=1670830 RepID=A0A8J3A8B7_9ACTN|nr:hypothetical protein [Egicoccus halophilus]GGI06330.1 hypothetical protein GCM10011354_18550 [Egicoccus halophilus]
MSSQRPLADPPPMERRIEQTVRRARRHWYRVGMPLGERRRHAAELRDHLVTVTERGGSIEDVVGTDLEAFANDWFVAGLRRPVLDVTLQLAAAVLLVPALLVLLAPLLGHDRFGFAPAALAYTGGIAGAAVSANVLRRFRHRLDGAAFTWAVLGLCLAGAVVGTTLRAWLEARDAAFVTVPVWLAVGLLVGSMVLLLAARRLRRSGAVR